SGDTSAVAQAQVGVGSHAREIDAGHADFGDAVHLESDGPERDRLLQRRTTGQHAGNKQQNAVSPVHRSLHPRSRDGTSLSPGREAGVSWFATIAVLRSSAAPVGRNSPPRTLSSPAGG